MALKNNINPHPFWRLFVSLKFSRITKLILNAYHLILCFLTVYPSKAFSNSGSWLYGIVASISTSLSGSLLTFSLSVISSSLSMSRLCFLSLTVSRTKLFFTIGFSKWWDYVSWHGWISFLGVGGRKTVNSLLGCSVGWANGTICTSWKPVNTWD